MKYAIGIGLPLVLVAGAVGLWMWSRSRERQAEELPDDAPISYWLEGPGREAWEASDAARVAS